MLKYLSILIITTSILLENIDARVTEDVKEKCRQDNGLSLEESRVLKANEALSENKKCYIRCLFVEGGYMENGGKILVDNMKRDRIAHADDKKSEKVYGCATKVDAVPTCDAIIDLVSCFTA